MDELLTTADAAEVLGVKPARVRQFVLADRIPVARRVRGALLLRRSDVEAFAALERPIGKPRRRSLPRPGAE